jgi:hypothetical protein
MESGRDVIGLLQDPTGRQRRPLQTIVTAVVVARRMSTATTAQLSS